MIGVLRNNLWSLRFNETTNILFATLDSLDIPQLQTGLRNFSQQTTFQIGHLTILKSENEWQLKFPGIPLSFANWIVSENAPYEQLLPLHISDKDLQTLLEYVVHMHAFGQLKDQ